MQRLLLFQQVNLISVSNFCFLLTWFLLFSSVHVNVHSPYAKNFWLESQHAAELIVAALERGKWACICSCFHETYIHWPESFWRDLFEYLALLLFLKWLWSHVFSLLVRDLSVKTSLPIVTHGWSIWCVSGASYYLLCISMGVLQKLGGFLSSSSSVVLFTTHL